eukprot:TRINITY_DN27109_c0_g1_i2.p1 TRINITY_DN27109_c0_g1~~TRINITY_DN27109_c0_g1_i2.p1  ORF type:complete len:648 (-),score=117.07 TRINITY_DN27109_c0_g1_i2:148-2091(-)
MGATMCSPEQSSMQLVEDEDDVAAGPIVAPETDASAAEQELCTTRCHPGQPPWEPGAQSLSSMAPEETATWSVRIETVYDRFETGTNRRNKSSFDANVLHTRLVHNDGVRQQVQLESDSDSSASDVESPAGLRSASALRRKLQRKGSSRAMRVEVVTRWAVVTAKVIHEKVLALYSVSNIVLDRVRADRCWESKSGRVKGSVKQRAQDIVKRAKILGNQARKQAEDCFHGEWLQDFPDDHVLTTLFGKDFVDTITALANSAKTIFASQPTVVEVAAPCRVVGDIHGQLRDLLILLLSYVSGGDRIIGSTKASIKGGAPMTYVFNGDFVDRGAHQLETIGLLLALKVAFPKNIWLIRGNHEDRNMNQKYGFEEECTRHLGEEMGKKTHALLEDVFDYLPMAAVVEERVLVVHGGIGRGDWDLNHLRTVARPLTSEVLAQEQNRWLLNILWSDPIADDAHNDSDNMSDHSECPAEVCGVHSSWRNDYSVRFGWNVTKSFCARNGLGLVVRSHQCKRDGNGFSVMHDNMLMRVFSARDYEGMGNDSATLLIDYDAAAMADSSESAWHTEAFDDSHVMSGSFESTALPSESSPAATMSGTMSSAGVLSGEEGQNSSVSMESAAMPLSFYMERKHLTVRAQVLASLTKARES